MIFIQDPREWWQFIAMILVSLCFCAYYSKRFGKLLMFSYFFFLMSAAIICWNPSWNPSFLMEVDKVVFRLITLEVWAQMLVLPLALLMLDSKLVWRALIVFFCVDALWILFGPKGLALVNGNTYDLMLMTLMTPYVLLVEKNKILKTAFIFLLVVASLKCFPRSAALVAISFFFSLAYHEKKNKTTLLGVVLISGFFVATTTLGNSFVSTSDRLRFWNHQFAWWFNNVDFFLGSGLGTFERIGAYLHIDNHRKYIMHNDFLQMLFECGFVGLVLFVVSYVKLYSDSRKELFAAMIVFGFFPAMLFYFPLHSVPGQTIAFLTIKQIYFGGKIKNEIGLFGLRNKWNSWRSGISAN